MPFHARAVAVVDYPATATYVLGVVCVARRARLDLSLILQFVPVFTDVPDAHGDAVHGTGGVGWSRQKGHHGSSAPGSFYARLRERQGEASGTRARDKVKLKGELKGEL